MPVPPSAIARLRRLRSHLILSHTVPMLLVTSLMGIALIWVLEGLARARTGATGVQIDYSQNLATEVADAWAPVFMAAEIQWLQRLLDDLPSSITRCSAH